MLRSLGFGAVRLLTNNPAKVHTFRAQGIEVVERHIQKEELSTFTECFIVGTAAEVTPVSEVGDFKFTPAKLSLDLMDTYAALVRGEAMATA